MLTDAQVERYSRQVILPEVGGRGQARLLAACVALTGDGPGAVAAATLLGRAGIGTLALVDGPAELPELSPDCRVLRRDAPAADVVVDLTGHPTPGNAGRALVLGVEHGDRIVVTTLVGRPCGACLPPSDAVAGARRAVLATSAAHVLGAVAAGEALRLLLAPPATGRVTTVDLGDGAVAITPLVGPGCVVCGTAS